MVTTLPLHDDAWWETVESLQALSDAHFTDAVGFAIALRKDCQEIREQIDTRYKAAAHPLPTMPLVNAAMSIWADRKRKARVT